MEGLGEARKGGARPARVAFACLGDQAACGDLTGRGVGLGLQQRLVGGQIARRTRRCARRCHRLSNASRCARRTIAWSFRC